MLNNYVFYTAIIKNGDASKLLQEAKNIGITGGTIMLTTTYSQNKILTTLGFNEERNEALLIILN